MNMTKLETIEELEVLVEKNEPYVLLNTVRHAQLVTVHTQNFKRIAAKKESTSVLLIRTRCERCVKSCCRTIQY